MGKLFLNCLNQKIQTWKKSILHIIGSVFLPMHKCSLNYLCFGQFDLTRSRQWGHHYFPWETVNQANTFHCQGIFSNIQILDFPFLNFLSLYLVTPLYCCLQSSNICRIRLRCFEWGQNGVKHLISLHFTGRWVVSSLRLLWKSQPK